MDALLAELTAIAGPDHVLTDPDLVAGYATDWTRRFSGVARGVVRPADAAEVAAVLRACARHGAAVVPQGGNTGLVGGGVPVTGGAVVLSARRLRRLDPVDILSGQVTAGAGVTIAELRAHAARAGLEYGVDLAARDSATVGGTVATNAGGIQTVRYGPTRAQLLGLEAVLADGTVVSRLGGIQADNTGYDLTQLLAGSEGTLGVITAARLRLWRADPPTLTLLAGLPGIEAAAAAAARISSLVPGVRAAEYFEAAGLALVRAHTGLPAPLGRDYPAYLLVDAAAGPDDAERLAVLPELTDAAVAMDSQARAALWAYRVDQRGRRTAQAGRGAARGAAGRVPGGSRRDHRQAGRARDRVRPHRRRQPARERARPRARRRPRRRCGAAPGRRARRHDLGRARHRPGEGGHAAPLQVRRGDRGDARHQARPRSNGPAQPRGAVLAPGGLPPGDPHLGG